MACASEGEDVAIPSRLVVDDADDAGIAARLTKKVFQWTSSNAGRLEVIRPGTFTAQFIRSTGLKTPFLIKGDMFNENPQMGLMWPDVHSISVDTLADHIGGERKVDTWDVVKQRPGPAWTLSQWCTYWHARQDAATRLAKPQTAQPAKAGFADDEDDDDGEVVDSGVVIVLQGAGHRHSTYTAARATGISPEQAQRLLDGECLPLHGSNLTQHIHPPPAIQSVDLVRPVEREMNRMPGLAGALLQDAGEGERRSSQVTMEIKPADTLHLQMTPKDCFTDFRLAPGGSATWLYVLLGSKVVVLFPPTPKNRRLYLTWGAASRANQAKENLVLECFLADYAEGVVKVEVKASQALIIPAGWFYATATPQDCIAVGCFFWHPYALGDVARAQQMELDLRTRPARFALPARQLLWFSGAYYAKQLRDKLGLQPPFNLRRPSGHGSAHRSMSETSLNQQQRSSPFLRGMSGNPLLRGSSATGQQVRAGGTPPTLALQQQGQQYGGMLSSPMACGSKRGRQEMDALCLGESAVPIAAAGTAAATGSGQKRLKITGVAKQPTTPHAGSCAAGGNAGQQQQAGVVPSLSGLSTPGSARRIGNGGMFGTPAAAAAAVAPSHSNHSDVRQQQQQGLVSSGTGSLQLRQQYQDYINSPQQQRGGYITAANRGGRYNYVINDDDDEGECHTSPVRRPEPGPLDDDGLGFGVEWGSGYVAGGLPQHTAAAAARSLQQPKGAAEGIGAASRGLTGVSTLKIKVPGRAQPLYSPVIQPMRGDLDSIPALTGQQTISLPPPAVTPPAAAAAARQSVLGGKGMFTAAASGSLPQGAAATPGKSRITLKGQGTPTAAAAAASGAAVLTPRRGGSSACAPGASAPARASAAGQEQSEEQQTQQQQRRSPDSSSAGSHAVVSAQTNTSSGQQQQQAAAATAVSRQRKLVLEATSDDEAEQQQQQQHQQQPHPSAAADVLPRHDLVRQQQHRRTSDGAARALNTTIAAGGAAAATGKPVITKLKIKMASPSPKLAVLPTPQTGPGVPPALSLDQAALQQQAVQQRRQQEQALQSQQVPAVQQQQQQQQVQAVQLQQGVIPQVDGAADCDDVNEGSDMLAPGPNAQGLCSMPDVVRQGQHAMQDLLSRQRQQRQQFGNSYSSSHEAGLWSKWQQLQCSLQHYRQHQQQQQCGFHTLYSIPQVDGAADDGRQVNATGPMLLVKPAAAPDAAAQLPQHLQQQVETAHVGMAAQTDVGMTAAVVPAVASPVSGVGLLSPRRTAADVTAGSAAAPEAASAAKAAVGSACPVVGSTTARGTPPPSSAVLLPLQSMPHSAAKPPVAKQQHQQQQLAQQHQQYGVVGNVSPAAAAVQPGHAALKPNPVLQPQVQKLKVAAAAAAATAGAMHNPSSPNTGSSPTGAASAAPGGIGQQEIAASAAPGTITANAVTAAGGQGRGANTAVSCFATPARAAVLTANDTTAAAVSSVVPTVAAADLLRRPSGVGDSMDPPPAAPAATQAAAPMLPPPPTRLSPWEITELPVVLEFLTEQFLEKAADVPYQIPDPEWCLQQFDEAVVVARIKDGEEAASKAAALASQQQQQQHGLAMQAPAAAQGALVAAAAEAAAAATIGAATQWNAGCGPLKVSAVSPDEMPAGFAEHVKTAQALFRSSGIVTAGTTANEGTTEVIGETGFEEQANSVGTGSWDNRSAGSIGGSRGAMATGTVAAAGRGGGRGTEGGIGHVRGQVKRGPSASQVPATVGAMQAKRAKQNQVMKGLGLKR